MDKELYYRIALTLAPNIGPVQAKILVDHFGDATKIFKASTSTLEKIDGIGAVRAAAIKRFAGFDRVTHEARFIEKHGVVPLFLTDPNYPQRLLNCYDPPTLLYSRGSAHLNASRVVAVVGTRAKTDYGRHLTENLLHELAHLRVTVVSGLALGIDAVAHKAALENGMPTIGVIAHGLDNIYPAEHGALVANIIKQDGALLTEFRSGVKPDRHHFPARNRIVAGISDCVIVIETGVKGGSIITAELAAGYNRDVFAFPGRTTDAKSAGCNYLISTNRAALLTGAAQLVELLGWSREPMQQSGMQRRLFTDLNNDEKIIVTLLQQCASKGIDELTIQSKLSAGTVAAALLNLELQNVITALPGKQFMLL